MSAQTPRQQASELFKRATGLYSREDYAGALELQQAQQLYPSHKIEVSIGYSLEKLGRLAEAAGYYERFLLRRADPTLAATVKAKLRKLRESLAMIALSCTTPGAVVVVDNQEVGRTPLAHDGGKGTNGQYTNTIVKCDLSGSGGAGGHANDTAKSVGGDGETGHFEDTAYATCGVDAGASSCSKNNSKGVTGARGGDGAAGSGGGILLKAPTVQVTGTVSTGVKLNGGTLKVFHRMSTPPQTSQLESTVGRLHVTTY